MQPKINQQLFIQILTGDREGEKEEYKSRIADLRQDYIYMEVPLNIKTGKLKRLRIGDLLSVYYVNQEGVKHHFTTEVTGFGKNVIPEVIIRMPDPDSISKEQRRGFLRVPAELELSIKATEQCWMLGVTEDISGGGLSAIFDGTFPLHLQAKMPCWLLLPFKSGAVEHVPFQGETLRVKMLETGRQLAKFKFSEIACTDQQKIIRYCFEKQLMNKK